MLQWINSAPNKPVTTPKTIAAGKASIAFSVSALSDENFRAPESDKLNGLPFNND